MDLSDCEILYLAPRGHSAAVIVGPHALAPDELQGLHRQFAARHPDAGAADAVYWSPEGWQGADRAPAAGPIASRFAFDEGAEVVTIDGLRVAAALIDGLTRPTPAGEWLRVISTDDGVITLQSRCDLIEPSATVQAPAIPDTSVSGEAGMPAGPGAEPSAPGKRKGKA